MNSCMFNLVENLGYIATLSRNIMDKLIYSHIDSINGICITTQSTYFKHMSLDVNMPPVLHQYYGVSKLCHNNTA